MATGVIGSNFTFQAMFRDASGAAIVLTTPLVSVFYFNAVGARTNVVDAATPSGPTPAEAGRYVYGYTIASSFTAGDVLYAEFSGTYPGTGNPVLVQQDVALVAPTSGSMIARFVQGG